MSCCARDRAEALAPTFAGFLLAEEATKGSPRKPIKIANGKQGCSKGPLKRPNHNWSIEDNRGIKN